MNYSIEFSVYVRASDNTDQQRLLAYGVHYPKEKGLIGGFQMAKETIELCLSQEGYIQKLENLAKEKMHDAFTAIPIPPHGAF